jgi:hypothetical protein
MGFTTSAVIAVVGAVYVADQQQELAEEQAKSNEERQRLGKRQADVSAARERAKQVRQARAARASALAQSQSGEGTGGSGLAGTQANIGSQTGSNIAFLEKQRQISKELSDLNVSTANRQARIRGRAAVGQVVTQGGQAGMTKFS